MASASRYGLRVAMPLPQVLAQTKRPPGGGLSTDRGYGRRAYFRFSNDVGARYEILPMKQLWMKGAN
jgi:hypothetical protein